MLSDGPADVPEARRHRALAASTLAVSFESTYQSLCALCRIGMLICVGWGARPSAGRQLVRGVAGNEDCTAQKPK